MHRLITRNPRKMDFARLLVHMLLLVSCLFLAACQTVQQLPEASEQELEQPQPEPEQEAEPQPEPGVEQELEPEPGAEPEPDSEADPQPDSEVEPLPEPEPAPDLPTISSVTPASALPGEVVMVLGTGFGKRAGELRALDGSLIPVIYWSDERIDFTVPSTSLPIRIVPVQSADGQVHALLTDEHLLITEPPGIARVLISSGVSVIDVHSTVTIRFAVHTVDEAGTAISPGAVEWQLSDTAVAKIVPTGEEHSYALADTWYEELTVRALQIGTVKVTATVAGQSASSVLTVQDHMTGLSVQPTALDLVIGSNTEGSVTAFEQLASGADAPAAGVSWFSSDPRIATVDNGVVTAVSEGTAVITAFAAGHQSSVDVSVSDPLVQLAFTAEPKTLRLGDSVQLAVERVLASGTRQADDGSTLWTSGSGAISVTDDGIITAHSAGSATIRASAGSVTAELTVAAIDHVTDITFHRVSNDAQVEQLRLFGTQNSLFPVRLYARLHYYSGAAERTNTELDWESTSPQFARIEANGANYRILTLGSRVGSTILYATHPESGTRRHLIVHVSYPEANR